MSSSGHARAISIVLEEPGTDCGHWDLPHSAARTPQRGGVLTPGEGPSQQGDVVAPAPSPGVQVVPELVIGSEINDGGWHSHDPARRRRGVRGTGPPWGLAGGLAPVSVCLAGGSGQNPHTHRVGGKPLHRDLMPS